MAELLTHVGGVIATRKLLPSGSAVLAAVSGGLDSMVMLQLLYELAIMYRWKLTVAHFNHQLRGCVSDADERFVRNYAGSLGLAYVAGHGNVRQVAKRKGFSMEMAARSLRHEFLARTARRLNSRRVALAHHADDQVELFFLRLFRGAGGDGLGGMKSLSPSPADKAIQLVRPLLDVSRTELEEYASQRRIPFRKDASNASREIVRNRIRNELLPLMRRRFQPSLNTTVLRVMNIIGAEAETMAGAARAWLRLPRRDRYFHDLEIGLQRRVIQLQLQRLKIEPNYDLIETLRLSPGKPVMVANDLCVACGAAGTISRHPVPAARFGTDQLVIGLAGRAGEVLFGGVKFNWHFVNRAGARLPRAAPGRELLDADRIGPRIILRYWRPGDRFQPIGMASPVKLQDWFTNQKVPSGLRRQLVLATTVAGLLFWVEGQRIGESAKLTPSTRRRLKWTWRRLQA